MNKIPKLVGIVGSGQMGLGITQLLADQIPILLTDKFASVLESAIPLMKASLEKFLYKGKLDKITNVSDAIGRVQVAESMTGMKGEDSVIEAASENEEVKIKIIRA